MTRLAVVADIHGNRWALAAVLDDARRRGATRLLDLGDVFYGPLDPEGTAHVLMSLELPSVTVRGNEDRVLFEVEASASAHPSLGFTLASLPPAALDWLRAAPTTARADGAWLFHGTPEADDRYLLETVEPGGVRLRRPEELAVLLQGAQSAVVLCGHSHLPHAVCLPGGTLVVNPGSVGLPAYSDDTPFPHSMEAGSPLARYAILEPGDSGWSVAELAIPYDWESAARAAEDHGRPDWARALRTGWAR